ncbi:MAG: hypothetical protein JAZ11_13935 [Candidatus Thiodiazotropha lotti]|nr:hypothetical protein [Candidatus Thiodiazotropha lotti]
MADGAKTYEQVMQEEFGINVNDPEETTYEQVMQDEFGITIRRKPFERVTQEPEKSKSSVMENLGTGALRTLKGTSATVGDIVTGIAEIPYTGAQMGLAGMDALSPAGSDMESQVRKWRKSVDKNLAGIGPFYDRIFGGGDTYGRVIGQMIGTAPLGALKLLNPATFTGAAALGGASGLLSQPTTEEDPGDFFQRKAGQAAVGSVFGLGGWLLEPVVGRALKPFQKLDDFTARSGQAAADRLGIDLTPAKLVNSPTLEQIEGTARGIPLAGGQFRKIDDFNTEAINNAELKALGRPDTDAGDLSGALLGQVRKDVGKKIGKINQGGFIKRDKLRRLKDPLLKIKKENEAMRGNAIPEVKKIIEGFESLIEDGAPEKIAGKTVQQIRTKLDSQIRSLSENKAGYGGIKHALVTFKQVLDDAMVLPKKKTKRLHDLNRQYATTKLLGKKGVLKDGKIMPTPLNNALWSSYKRDFPEGNIGGELADIANVGRIYRNKIPDSGTITRKEAEKLMTLNFLAWPQAAGAGLFTKAYLSKPVRHWLTEGIGPDMSWLSRALPYAAGPYSANRMDSMAGERR